MNQPIPNSSQEAWLEVQEKGMVTFPKRWRDELGMQNGMFVKAKKEGQRVIIEMQAIYENPSGC
jgi:bifunctional DNA-binding transcriptional regulator/antitoxin component of YhaV-PrlF toxin-antitoxin module